MSVLNSEYQWFTHTYKTNFELIDFKNVEFKFSIRLDENRKNWYIQVNFNNKNVDVLTGEFNTEVTDEVYLEFCEHITKSEDVKKHLIKFVDGIYRHSELNGLLNIAKKVL